MKYVSFKMISFKIRNINRVIDNNLLLEFLGKMYLIQGSIIPEKFERKN